MINKFLTQYKQVFTDNDTIMACGRNNCVQLINLANKVEPDVSHGNLGTGHMEVEAIVKLKQRLTEGNK